MSNKNSLNQIAFRRGQLVTWTDRVQGQNNVSAVASLQAELMNLGFVLDPSACAYLKQVPVELLAKLYAEILPVAKEMVGAKRNYRPMYRNFPEQVMEMSALELFLNAMAHYESEGTWEPPHELAERGVAFENTEFRTIKLTSEEEFKQLFVKLVSINSALSPADRELLQWFIEHYGTDLPLPESVPFKETLCLLASYGLDVPVKTTTDVLRIATFLSGGDISLPNVPKIKTASKKTGLGRPRYSPFRDQFAAKHASVVEARAKFRFKHFKRAERRYLLNLLEKTNLDTSDMQQRLERWLRLGEILHVGEYKSQFPRTFKAFQALRNQDEQRIRSYYGKLDLAFAANDLNQALDLLSQRPGEFGRRLDWLMRKYELSEDQEQVFEAFEKVGPRISSKVLFELHDFLQRRLKPMQRSVALKKGSKARTLLPLPPLKKEMVVRGQQAVTRSLVSLISKLEPLGKVYIDERLREVALPTAVRGMNTGVVTYVRGTRIPFRPEAKVIRPFIHWYDQHGREDLDLSAGFLREDYSSVAHISFTSLRNHALNAVHSGDIRHRRGECAEYIDIDIERALANDVRYVSVHVYNYNGRPMHTMQECFFGLMEREHAGSNEIFEPKTVSNAISVANESTSVLLCVIDLLERKYIWMDMEIDRSMALYENTLNQTLEAVKSVVESGRLTVYDLLLMHTEARGTLVAKPEEADAIYRWEDFVSDYAKTAQFLTF